jgi:hypothetical protein
MLASKLELTGRVQRGAVETLVALTGVNNTCKLAATALVALADTHANALVAHGAVQALLSLLASGNLDVQVRRISVCGSAVRPGVGVKVTHSLRAAQAGPPSCISFRVLAHLACTTPAGISAAPAATVGVAGWLGDGVVYSSPCGALDCVGVCG